MSAYKDQPETWQDVMDFIRANRLDMDEYFDFFGAEVKARDTIFWRGAQWVSSFVVKGTSEGWYVHVGQITKSNVQDLCLLGKFWSSKAAHRAARMVTDYIYGGIHYARYSLIGHANSPADGDDWYRGQARREYEIDDVLEFDPDAKVERGEQEHWDSSGKQMREYTVEQLIDTLRRRTHTGAWVTARIWIEDPEE